MTADGQTVFVVDDNAALRKSLRALLAASGIPTETYASGREFLAAYERGRPGCLVLDLRLRGESGLDVLDELRARKASLPVIVLTAHGTVAGSVRALKGGAIDFIQKPAPPRVLVARIEEALQLDRQHRDMERSRESVANRIARLTPRERQVMQLLVAGKRSKAIAAELNVSVRTVEGYRSRILVKMNVASAPELIAAVVASSET